MYKADTMDIMRRTTDDEAFDRGSTITFRIFLIASSWDKYRKPHKSGL